MRPNWESLLEPALERNLIFVLGATDTGKTTLVTYLANFFYRRGDSVGVIDTDMGQSDIGPPTTIGLGEVTQPVTHLRELPVRGLYFVGTTSPRGNLLPTVVGSRQMLDKALNLGLRKIIFDTTGLVEGDIGRALKEHKLQVIRPEVIICLQFKDECEPILRSYAYSTHPLILRLQPLPGTRKKTPTERAQNREDSFKRYFANSQDIKLNLTQVNLMGTALFSGVPLSSSQLKHISHIIEDSIIWGEKFSRELLLVTIDPLQETQLLSIKKYYSGYYIKGYTLNEFKHLLVGLMNKDHEALALGILKSLDFETKQTIISTPLDKVYIQGIKFGKMRLPFIPSAMLAD